VELFKVVIDCDDGSLKLDIQLMVRLMERSAKQESGLDARATDAHVSFRDLTDA
jgi:hypothetical protein